MFKKVAVTTNIEVHFTRNGDNWHVYPFAHL